MNVQPDAGVPNAACGTAIVIVFDAWDATTEAVPTWLPFASTQTGDAKPCTSRRSLHADVGAIV